MRNQSNFFFFRKMYNVVVFENNSIAIISHSWLTDKDRACYWPSKSKKASFLARDNVLPDFNTWTLHKKIKIKLRTGT